MPTNVFTALPTFTQTAEVTGDPSSTGFFNTVALTVTGLPALATNELRVVSVTAPALESGVFIVGWKITAANQLTVLLYNNSGSPVDPASQTFEVIVA